MQPKTKEIIEKFPSGVVVETKLEFKNLLRESQTNFYCYMVVADNMAGHIIGQGTGERAAFLFGGAAPGHIKAFTRVHLHIFLNLSQLKEFHIFQNSDCLIS